MVSATAVGVIWAVVFLAAAYQIWLRDRLVQWEYEHHRDQWERDGKPSGFFWRAKECTSWSSRIAKNRVSGAWLYKAPCWVAASPECRRWLAQARIISIVATMAILIVTLTLIFRMHPRA
jgi:hypothetical protein